MAEHLESTAVALTPVESSGFGCRCNSWSRQVRHNLWYSIGTTVGIDCEEKNLSTP